MLLSIGLNLEYLKWEYKSISDRTWYKTTKQVTHDAVRVDDDGPDDALVADQPLQSLFHLRRHPDDRRRRRRLTRFFLFRNRSRSEGPSINRNNESFLRLLPTRLDFVFSPRWSFFYFIFIFVPQFVFRLVPGKSRFVWRALGDQALAATITVVVVVVVAAAVVVVAVFLFYVPTIPGSFNFLFLSLYPFELSLTHSFFVFCFVLSVTLSFELEPNRWRSGYRNIIVDHCAKLDSTRNFSFGSVSFLELVQNKTKISLLSKYLLLNKYLFSELMLLLQESSL